MVAQSLLLDTALAGERLIAVGEHGHVIYSDDSGKHWQQGKVPTTQMLTAVFFTSPKKGWAVGHDGIILFTRDGGENWILQRDGLASQQQINLENREKTHLRVRELEQALTAIDDESDDARTRAELELELDDATMDQEDADLTMEEAISAPPLMDIWFRDENTGWAVGAFGTVVHTSNGGQSWLTHAGAIDNEDEYHYYAITGDRDGRLFIAGEAGGLYRSIDAGASWESLDSPYDGSWFGVLHSDSPELLLVFGLRGSIFRSTDFGDSWRATTSTNTMTLAGGNIAPDGTIVLVGSVGAVLYSSDDGGTFEAQMQEDRRNLNSVISTPGGNYYVAGQAGIRSLKLPIAYRQSGAPADNSIEPAP